MYWEVKSARKSFSNWMVIQIEINMMKYIYMDRVVRTTLLRSSSCIMRVLYIYPTTIITGIAQMNRHCLE